MAARTKLKRPKRPGARPRTGKRGRRPRRMNRNQASGLRAKVLDTAVPYVFLSAGDATVKLLKSGLGPRGLYFTAREQLSRRLVETMIQNCDGDGRLASRVLGISYSTLKAVVVWGRRQDARNHISRSRT